MAPYDSNYKMKPPLRSCGHRDAIVDGLAAGTIGAIATDHAPHPGCEKMQEFERCPFGIIGLETAIALALEELVTPGRITLSRMVELFTTGPEAVMRLGRGTLAPGAPGDVTVFSYGRGVDVRRESVSLTQPELSVPRANVPRRSDGDGGGRRDPVAPVGWGVNPSHPGVGERVRTQRGDAEGAEEAQRKQRRCCFSASSSAFSASLR